MWCILQDISEWDIGLPLYVAAQLNLAYNISAGYLKDLKLVQVTPNGLLNYNHFNKCI